MFTKENKFLKSLTPQERILFCYKLYNKSVSFITGLGPSGICILYYLNQLKINVPIYFVDTGYNFNETLELKVKLEDYFHIEIKVLQANQLLRDYVSKGSNQSPCTINPNLCCHILKVTPILEVLPNKKAWFSGLRKSQSALRSKIETINLDGRGTVKVCPVFDWSYDDVKSFISKHDLPYNPLLDLGYKSVGCKDVTTKSLVADSCERSGRWYNSDQTECGINVF